MNTNTNTNTAAQTSATPSENTKAQQSAMPGSLRPRWCVQRDANTVVPLIAIDELPDLVILKDVPLSLTILEALKARIELVAGDYPVHGIRYQLVQPINTRIVANDESDDSGSDSSPASEGSESSTQKGSPTSDKKGNKNAAENFKDKPARATLTTNATGIIDTMAKKGTIGKKVYCTYWIQTGNCNYMQEGCKYKHEIPEDEETRRSIGFRDIPTWPREELPIHIKPVPALTKPWRRQDGKPEGPGARSPSKRGAASPPAAKGTPIVLGRGNHHASASASTHGPAAHTQYNANATAFAAPYHHFPGQANTKAPHRPFTQAGRPFLGNGAPENYQQRPAQNHTSPPTPAYNQAIVSPPAYNQGINGGRSGRSPPPKQPPISRPANLGQSQAGQQQNDMGASERKVAPDYHILNRAGGLSGVGAPAPGGSHGYNNAPQGYSGMPSNWTPLTNAPTSMDISFIAPTSDSTRSGSHAIYTPDYTPNGTSATPTLNNTNTFGSLNGNATSDSRAGTPAHYNGTSSIANNVNIPVKGRGPVHFGRNSPAPSTGSTRNVFQASTIAEESDTASIASPPVQHRVFFREEGQPEFVTNPPEPKSNQNGKAAHGLKKHGKKAHGANGAKSARGKMHGNGYELLIDTDGQ